MSATTIVVVEDESAIREGVGTALKLAGYETILASDGQAGLEAARRPGISLVLLDLMLPKMDGIKVLTELRRTHPTLPVIILTARGEEDERVNGLRAGADDYVVKPFGTRELMARVEAVLRRSPERPEPVLRITVGQARVDLERREISSPNASPLVLSETECSILSHLAANHGRVISRDELLTRLWGLSGTGIETRTVDMHVARLRAKLASANGGSHEEYIATVRGKGYMLGGSVKLSDDAGGSS